MSVCMGGCRTAFAVRRAARRRYGSSTSAKSGASVSPLRRLVEDASTFGEAAPATEPELRWATQPYAAERGENEETRPRTDPRHTAVLLFPGDGAHFPGMGRRLTDLPKAREIYDLASSVVGWNVWATCTGGGERELAERSATCVLVTSLAALERLRESRPAAVERVRAVAGFGVGELTALAFAGALSTERAVRLAELRAAAVRAAASARPQAALTVWLSPSARLGAALAAARDKATERGVEDPVCAVSAYLYPGCRAVAGDVACLEWLEEHGREWGVVRCARVKAAPALHSPLMAEAAAAMGAGVAAGGQLSPPRVRVVSGCAGRAVSSARELARLVGRAPALAVRWEQALQCLYARPRGEPFPLTVAVGPGSAALRATLRQVNARAWDSSLQIDV